MRAAGAELLADVSRRAGVGTTEVVASIPGIYRVYRRLRLALQRDPPSVLVLVDFPEFNLRLAGVARRLGVPVVYFVPPQIWVWRRWRIRPIRRRISLVLAVFPFERALYADAGVPVEFVGHPVLDSLGAAPSRDEARRALGIENAPLVIGLLPGSRHGEAVRLLPLLTAAAAKLGSRWPAARFLLAQAPTLDDGFIESSLAGAPAIRVVRNAHAVMRAADLLLVASGTATLEAGLLGTPMVVCYRVSWVSEVLARILVRVPWINLVNLTLGRAAVPELRLHHETTVERLVEEASRLIESPQARQAQEAAFAELHGELGERGVAMRAAQIILGGGFHPPSDGRHAPGGAFLPASPQDQESAGEARARSGTPTAPPESAFREGLRGTTVRSIVAMLGRRLLHTIAPSVGAALVRLTGLTWRVNVVGAEHVEGCWREGRPVIYIVWHGRILLVPWLNQRLRRTRGARAPVVLASRSRDGELVARYVKHFGLSVVRGSSSRGGGTALRALVAAIRAGDDVAIVPDGPRGPRERLQPGVVALAALTGAPVVPLAVGARPARRLGSWDRFLVPLPFARCVLAFGAPVPVDRDADREHAAKALGRALADVTERADALAAGAATS
jgi:lipid-A-disaccharide synthase